MSLRKFTVLCALLLFLAAFAYVFIPPFFRSGASVDVPVYSRSHAREIGRGLKERGLLAFEFPFRVLTKITGADRRLKAGLYRMNPRMSLWRVVETLSSGRSELLTLRIPEGFTAAQIAKELETMKVIQAAEFLALVGDGGFLGEVGIEGSSAEGFLFPETYRVPLGAGPRALAELMVRQFQAAVGPDFQERCRKRGLTPYRAVILASIVEKEARLKEERPIVAGVLFNRLEKRMRLQVNATLNYVLDTRNPWLTNEQLETKSPYNTYLRGGLPPTPICSPGLASLEAVLAPADTPYLYYVAQGDGSHLFAETYEEHQKNVREAKRERRRQRLERSSGG